MTIKTIVKRMLVLGIAMTSILTTIQCAAEQKTPFFKLSLAQWSIHKMVFSGEASPYDFARLASEWGFEGLEYVSQMYRDVIDAEDKDAAMETFVSKSKAAAEQYGLKNVLIMVDNEGNLSAPEEAVREQAVANHMRWVKAAAALGCHAIRVNLSGSDDPEIWTTASIAGLSALATQAAAYNINVLVENHGGLSSNAALLMQVINTIDLPNCGTLPDFGNFCLKGHRWARLDPSCEEVYPIYQGVEEMMPRAFAVSAKSYNFDDQGQETQIDYSKMLEVIKAAGYTGFIGVEYEGENLTEAEGIKATKNLLLKSGSH